MEFGVMLNDFSESLTALREFAQQIGSFLQQRTKDQLKDHADDLGPFVLAVEATQSDLEIPDNAKKRLLSRFGKVEPTRDAEGRIVGFTFERMESGQRFVNAIKVIEARAAQTSLLYCSSLISLTSAAEWFLSRLIQGFFEKFPNAASTQEKTFSLDDLKGFDSMADAKRQLFEMRVSEIMFGSLKDWVKFLKAKMQLSMGYLDPHLEEIVEIFQRRNVVAHNNGVVHHSYLAKVDPIYREGISAGDKLAVSADYIIKAIDLIEVNFILIGAEFWKKMDSGDKDRGGVLTDVAFNALTADRFTVAEGISFFLMNDRGLPETSQLNGRLNYWQSLKWQGRFGEVRADVENADFSAKGELFQLARFALLNQRVEFFKILPSVLDSKKLGYKALGNWPIFREMREQEQYQKFYQDHRGDFDADDGEGRPPGGQKPQEGGTEPGHPGERAEAREEDSNAT